MESAPNAVRLDTEANTAAAHMTKARPKARRESRDVMQRASVATKGGLQNYIGGVRTVSLSEACEQQLVDQKQDVETRLMTMSWDGHEGNTGGTRRVLSECK